MEIKPFKWPSLKRVSGRTERLIESLFEFLPATEARDELALAIRKVLMKHLGEKSFFYLDAVDSIPFGEFLSGLGDYPLVSVIGLTPITEKMYVHIDPFLAYLIIDRLIGGDGKPSSESRPITETEQGIVQYFIMQILSQVYQVCSGSPRIHFRFERFLLDPRGLQETMALKEEVVMLTFKVGIGDRVGFIRLICGTSFIERASAGGAKGDPEVSYFEKRLAKYDYISTLLWAEAGSAKIAPRELVALEAGDVIIFDETGLTVKDKDPAGEAILRVGDGEEGGLLSKVEAVGGRLRCEIIGG